MSAPDPWSFTFEPLYLALTAAAAVLYLRYVRPRSTGRTIVFALGLLFIAAPLNSPLETVAIHYLLMAHLAQNAMIADFAPPLLILGLTPAAREVIEHYGGSTFELLTRPVVALPLWLGVWYTVHLSGIYDILLSHPVYLNGEHALLIATGLIFWWPVLCGTPRASLTPPSALLYLMGAFLGSVFLGLGLTWLPSFYPYYQHVPRLGGMSVNEDQNVGGALMMGEQSLVFVAGMSWVFFRLIERSDEDIEPQFRHDPA